MTRENVRYEGTSMLELIESSRAMPLELAVPAHSDRTCACCGAPLAITGTCAYCGTAARTSASVIPPLPQPAPIASEPVTAEDRFWGALADVPMGFWKRVAVYPLLALVLGAGCTCRGVSSGTAAMLVVVAIVGALGVVACLRDQRSP